jgi:hypothetical protein
MDAVGGELVRIAAYRCSESVRVRISTRFRAHSRRFEYDTSSLGMKGKRDFLVHNRCTISCKWGRSVHWSSFAGRESRIRSESRVPTRILRGPV